MHLADLFSSPDEVQAIWTMVLHHSCSNGKTTTHWYFGKVSDYKQCVWNGFFDAIGCLDLENWVAFSVIFELWKLCDRIELALFLCFLSQSFALDCIMLSNVYEFGFVFENACLGIW